MEPQVQNDSKRVTEPQGGAQKHNQVQDHRENKAYSLGLSQLSVFIAVAMNTDGFFSYQCIRFIFSMTKLRNYSMIILWLCTCTSMWLCMGHLFLYQTTFSD